MQIMLLIATGVYDRNINTILTTNRIVGLRVRRFFQVFPAYLRNSQSFRLPSSQAPNARNESQGFGVEVFGV